MTKQCAVGKTLNKDGKEVFVCDETKSQLLPLLHEVQKEKGFISDEDMQAIADRLGIHPVEVYSVVTFYSFFTTKPKGKNIVRVSNCISCEMAGSEKIVEVFEKAL